ncbi:MAG: TlpA disulfide reductase family protein [Candidatus Sulfopaludibacter sp.]|nr:TlpA disulfide reductase family protein [Candidatus Sulfopaludibacter sp.]
MKSISATGLVTVAALAAFTVWITARAKTLEEDFDNRGSAINAAGKAAPALSLPSLDGHMVSLTDYRGKKVLIVYWASWCSPCKAEMPTLNRLYRGAAGTSFAFEILAVSVDEDRAEAEKFARENGMTFPVLLDPGQKTVDRFHVESVPSMIVVDSAGTIIFGRSGFDPRSQLDLANKLGFPGRFGMGGMDGRRGN